MVNSRISSLLLSVCLLLFARCKEDTPNVSSIRVTHQGYDFIPTDVLTSPNGTIEIFGQTYVSITTIAFPTELKKYRPNLDTIETIRISESDEYDDDVHFARLDDGNWIIPNVYEIRGFTYSDFDLIKADENFNIIKRVNLEHDSTHSPDINDVLTRGGKTYLSWEEFWLKQREAISYIAIFDSDLNEVFRKNLNKSLESTPGFLATESPKITLSESGEIFYSFLAHYTTGTSLVYGMLDANGQDIYEKEMKLTTFIKPVNAILKDNVVILSAIEDPGSEQLYFHLNRSNGDLIEEVRSDISLTNSTYVKPNKLVEYKPDHYGHLLFNPFLKNLQFVDVQTSGVPAPLFDVPIPDFDLILAYRHSSTPDGNLIFAISYYVNDEVYFVLLKYSPEGELIQ